MASTRAGIKPTLGRRSIRLIAWFVSGHRVNSTGSAGEVLQLELGFVMIEHISSCAALA